MHTFLCWLRWVLWQSTLQYLTRRHAAQFFNNDGAVSCVESCTSAHVAVRANIRYCLSCQRTPLLQIWYCIVWGTPFCRQGSSSSWRPMSCVCSPHRLVGDSRLELKIVSPISKINLAIWRSEVKLVTSRIEAGKDDSTAGAVTFLSTRCR